MTFKDWLRTVAAALNDDMPDGAFQRYALKDMVAAYNAALCLVAKYRPDEFTEIKNIKLNAGKYQDIRSCCSNVLGVLDQVDANGNIIKELSKSRTSSSKASRNWKKPSCIKPVGVEYVVSNTSIDPNLNGRFEVYPPVPCGVDAYVLVKCVATPCMLSEADLEKGFNGDCTMNTAAWHYVLATMLAGDRFASGSTQQMQYHYRMFFDILGVVQKAEDRIESKEQA